MFSDHVESIHDSKSKMKQKRNLQKTRNTRIRPQFDKEHLQKICTNIILDDERLGDTPLKLETSLGWPHILLEVLATSVRPENHQYKTSRIERKKQNYPYLQMTVFPSLFLQHPKESIGNIVKVEFSKFAGRSTQGSGYIWIYSRWGEIEVRNTIPFTINPKNMKCLDINFTKHIQDP